MCDDAVQGPPPALGVVAFGAAAEAGGMLIEVVNWDKYNARGDAKHWSWLRLQNDVFDDEDLDDFVGGQFVVWIYALTRRNKANTAVFKLNERHCGKKAGFTEEQVVETLRLLVARGKLKVHPEQLATVQTDQRALDVPARTDPNVDVRERTDPFPTDGRTNERTNGSVSPADGQRPAPPGPKDLARLWNEVSHPNMKRVVLADFRASQPRYRQANARLVEKPDLAYWRQVIERMNQSPFHRGEVPPRDGRKPWRGNFDFLVRPDSARKVLEGEYDDSGAAAAKPKHRSPIYQRGATA
jgi:hypothetical protein